MTGADTDEADRVAVEYVIWAAGRPGANPMVALQDLGLSWHGRRAPDWHDAALAIACAWRRLQAPAPKLRRVA